MNLAPVGVEVEGLEPHNCKCIKCKSMCLASPCFPTPEEVLRLEKMGFGDDLAFSMFVNPETMAIETVIAPKTAVDGILYQCTFHSSEGLCELHDLGLKPTEGRLAGHDQPHENTVKLRLSLCRTWDSGLGRSLIEKYNANYRTEVSELKEVLVLELLKSMVSL